MEYYLVVEEWCYPTESGRNFLEDFDTIDEAKKYAKNKCIDEETNFIQNTQYDCLDTQECFTENSNINTYIITSKMGLDPYYYSCRIIKVETL